MADLCLNSRMRPHGRVTDNFNFTVIIIIIIIMMMMMMTANIITSNMFTIICNKRFIQPAH